MAQDIKILIGKRSQLYRKLLKYRDVIPGSVTERKLTCGKPNCICKREGKLHTGYQYSYKIEKTGKPKTKWIPKELYRQVESQVTENKEFKNILKEIHKINLEILFIKLKSKK
jgi:hypothetical protein